MNNLTLDKVKGLRLEISCGPVKTDTITLGQLFTEEYLNDMLLHILDEFENSTPTMDDIINEIEDIVYPEVYDSLDIAIKV